jgi:hypothetical protein
LTAALSKVEVMAFEIDPVKYGVLWQKVEDYEKKFDSMERKIDKMEAQLEKLVGLADQSRGGFWAGMMIVSVLSSLTGWVIHWFSGK